MKTQRSKEMNVGMNGEDFGVVDSKGRAIGAEVATYELDFVEIENPPGGYSEVPPGHYFVMCPHATRGGKRFGALQREQYFETETERNLARAKYFAGARKRAAKLGQQK